MFWEARWRRVPTVGLAAATRRSYATPALGHGGYGGVATAERLAASGERHLLHKISWLVMCD
jgi:hypothetical protein